jgi:hypothetical protein
LKVEGIPPPQPKTHNVKPTYNIQPTTFNTKKMADIAINGLLYSWADVRINLLGRDIVGILAVDYEDG